MVFMLRLISGLLVVCSYAVGTTEIAKSPIQSHNATAFSNGEKTAKDPSSFEFNTLTPYKLKLPITDQDVENIVKPFKFSTESKENTTSLKLKKSEPYTSVNVPDAGVNRTTSGRSVDIDAPVDHNAVYTLPDTKEYTNEDGSFKSFHSTEEVSPFESSGELTTPKTPYFDRKFKETVESINKKFDNFPETDIENATLSKNYSSDNFIDGLGGSFDDAKLQYKTFEKVTNNTQTEDDETEKIKQTRKTVFNETKYNISTSYEENTPNVESNELHKETSKRLLNDDTVNEVKQDQSYGLSTPKHLHVTTLKYSITKPSTEGGDSAIISNKIEGETTTTPLSTLSLTSSKPNNPRRGSIKFADYNKIKLSTVPTPSSDKPPEQTVEENQVVPVHVTAPNIESALSDTHPIEAENITTTTRTETILPRNKNIEPIEQQSTTVYIFVQPEDMKDITTIRNEINEVQKTSVASTPRAFQPLSTKEGSSSETTIISHVPLVHREEISTVSDSDEKSTAVTSFPRGFSLPTTTDTSRAEQSSTEIEEETTSNTILGYEKTTTENYKTHSTNSLTEATRADATTETPSTAINNEDNARTSSYPDDTATSSYSFETTSDALESITLPESTTVITRETTVTDLRSSKNIRFTGTTEPFTTQNSGITTSRSESFETTTNIDLPEITTFKSDDSSGITTTDRPEDSRETTVFFSNEISTKRKTEATTERTTIFPTTINEISSSVSEEVTSESGTKVVAESTPTKTLLENETTEEKPTQESKTKPTTSFDFVHIKTIDKNHTTLTPDELKPNEIYTTPVPASESTETIKTTTETPSEETTSSGLDGPSSGSGAVVAIIISCVGGVCLIALACLLIVMRNRQNRFNYGQRCRPVSLDDYSVDNVSVFNSVRRKAAIRGSKMSYGNPAFEDPVCLTHPLTFPAISKFANNLEDVTAEFHDIPQIVARTSELPEGCETKNRYANVIPLPESRVFLNHIDGYTNSDYINANFVTGPKNIRKYYIACQAPMSNTVDDFWRMIWEQQSKVVLMLTHLFENGIEKCFDYLPPSEVLDCHRLFGDYQVTLKKREVKEKYIISSIQLKNMVSNSWREVTHFWYMGWPEKGVPAEANSIIAFLIEARSYMKTVTIDKKITRNGDMNGAAEVNPVVVHCSPGTGRTGAVITCDIAIREFEQTRQVDIPKIVYKIRRDRAGAVQTKEQYAFIYKVIDLYATKLAGGNLESI